MPVAVRWVDAICVIGLDPDLAGSSVWAARGARPAKQSGCVGLAKKLNPRPVRADGSLDLKVIPSGAPVVPKRPNGLLGGGRGFKPDRYGVRFVLKIEVRGPGDNAVYVHAVECAIESIRLRVPAAATTGRGSVANRAPGRASAFP